jgi:hypothetical protein
MTPPTFVTEKVFQQQVLDLARMLGWRCYFSWTSIHSPAGFPDLVLVRGKEALFVELKSQRGKLKPAQEEWLDALREVEYVDAFCWRPEDWPVIEAALRPSWAGEPRDRSRPTHGPVAAVGRWEGEDE